MCVCVNDLQYNVCVNSEVVTAVYSWGYGSDGQTGTTYMYVCMYVCKCEYVCVGQSTLHSLRTPRRIDYLNDLQVTNTDCCMYL